MQCVSRPSVQGVSGGRMFIEKRIVDNFIYVYVYSYPEGLWRQTLPFRQDFYTHNVHGIQLALLYLPNWKMVFISSLE